MKVIKYNIYQSTVYDDTDTTPPNELLGVSANEETAYVGVDITLPKVLPWSEVNEETAKREAYKGEYTIEDDGQPEPVVEPSQLDVIEAQVAYTAMMTDTLLEV